MERHGQSRQYPAATASCSSAVPLNQAGVCGRGPVAPPRSKADARRTRSARSVHTPPPLPTTRTTTTTSAQLVVVVVVVCGGVRTDRHPAGPPPPKRHSAIRPALRHPNGTPPSGRPSAIRPALKEGTRSRGRVVGGGTSWVGREGQGCSACARARVFACVRVRVWVGGGSRWRGSSDGTPCTGPAGSIQLVVKQTFGQITAFGQMVFGQMVLLVQDLPFQYHYWIPSSQQRQRQQQHLPR